jgi:hypothetical protein
MQSKYEPNLDQIGLSNIMEKCIFNVKQLKSLKQKVIEMGIPESEAPQFTKALLTYLTKVLKDSIREISFYFDNWLTDKKLKEYAKEGNAEDREDTLSENNAEILRQQIKERNELLLIFKDRIAKIHGQITNSKTK